jgi:hypothetical protein
MIRVYLQIRGIHYTESPLWLDEDTHFIPAYPFNGTMPYRAYLLRDGDYFASMRWTPGGIFSGRD